MYSMKDLQTFLTPSAETKQMFNDAAPVMQVGGAINSALGAYYSAKTSQYQLESTKLSYEYQQQVAQLNAQMMEREAQSILLSAQYQNAATTMRYGKAKSATKASQAARGITLGIGNAAEEIATIDLMKETDSIMINANGIRAAAAARIKGAGIAAGGEMMGVSARAAGLAADQISPFGAAGSSLMGSAGSIAQSWYRDSRLMALEAKMSGK
jgi:hypothetical protein